MDKDRRSEPDRRSEAINLAPVKFIVDLNLTPCFPKFMFYSWCPKQKLGDVCLMSQWAISQWASGCDWVRVRDRVKITNFSYG